MKVYRLICVLALAAQLLLSQTAQITGRVADSSGAIITNVKLVLTNTETGVRAASALLPTRGVRREDVSRESRHARTSACSTAVAGKLFLRRRYVSCFALKVDRDESLTQP